MTFLDHLKELRKRIIISLFSLLFCMIIIFIYYTPIITLLSLPLEQLNSSLTTQQLFITSFFEGFTTKIKFSLLGGFILSMPIHLFHILRFSFPGLSKKEKKIISLCLFTGLCLAIFSLYLCFYQLLPFSIQFLTTTQFIPKNVGILLNFNQNIFYIFNFLCFAMILFQAPILLEIFMYLNLINRKKLFRASRYVIVIIFILTALITPPDIISQISLALPLILLFYLTIAIAKLFKFGETTCSD